MSTVKELMPSPAGTVAEPDAAALDEDDADAGGADDDEEDCELTRDALEFHHTEVTDEPQGAPV